MNFFLILVAAMVASSSCFAASIRSKREYIGKSTDGGPSSVVHERSLVGLEHSNNLILRRIRI